MYDNPGYSVFNWRGEEGIQPRGSAGRQAATAPNGGSWERQADLAAQQRQQQQAREEADRRAQLSAAQARANQYATASTGMGPQGWLPPPPPPDQSGAGAYQPVPEGDVDVRTSFSTTPMTY